MSPHKRGIFASLSTIMGEKSATTNPNAVADAKLDSARLALLRGRGDTERGARIVTDMFWRDFKNFYRANGQSDATAEELANDAIFKIVIAIDQLREPAKFRAWAWQIARNELKSRVRDEKESQAREVTLDDDGWQTLFHRSPNHAPDNPELSLCLTGQFEKFVAEHEDRYWLLERVALDGWGESEVMAALGRTATATRTYLKECRNRLRKYVKPCLEDAL
ncbi:MAG: RNA polymerase sigma factor [Aeromicrobium sp.]|nr:RNA polymerase sigma factor [Burkholderiales bacterium]